MKPKNIIFAVAFLLCTSQMYPMLTVRSMSKIKPRVMQKKIESFCTHNSSEDKYYRRSLPIEYLSMDEVKEWADDIGMPGCSQAYNTGKPCSNPFCSEKLYLNSANGVDKGRVVLNVALLNDFNIIGAVKSSRADLTVLANLYNRVQDRVHVIGDYWYQFKTVKKEADVISFIEHKQGCIRTQLHACDDYSARCIKICREIDDRKASEQKKE